MKTDLLRNSFDEVENPGLDTFDPRLGDITALVQGGKLDAAAPLVESVLEEGVCDIRIAAYYCHLRFNEEGVAALKDIFEDILELVTSTWDAVGPLKNREKIAQNSLTWFYKMLLKRLEREEAVHGDTWTHWVETLDSEWIEEVLTVAEEVRAAAAEVLADEAGPLLEITTKVSDWFRALQQVVHDGPEPEEEPEEEEPEEEPERSSRPAATGSQEQDAIVAEGSYHLKLLLKKLDAFERLIEEEKFSHAALVADDVTTIIGNFDPTLYFPKLFGSFMRLLAQYSEELGEFEDAKDTRAWQAMHGFYVVDLDGFLES